MPLEADGGRMDTRGPQDAPWLLHPAVAGLRFDSYDPGWGTAMRRGVLALAMVALCASAEAEEALRSRARDTEALQFLKSLPREWSGTSNRDCKTYEDKNLERLSRPFAVSAAAFLRAFVAMHGHVTITSAHRTAQEQSCVCEGEKGPCAGRPRIIKMKKRRIVVRGTSRHQTGLALDVRAGTGTVDEFTCMHEFAQTNPQFNVHFPLGMRDKPHLEPAKRGEPRVRVAALGSMMPVVTPCVRMKVMLVDAALD
jgi:hypothetical protein